MLWKGEDTRWYPLVIDISGPAQTVKHIPMPNYLFFYPEIASLGEKNETNNRHLLFNHLWTLKHNHLSLRHTADLGILLMYLGILFGDYISDDLNLANLE